MPKITHILLDCDNTLVFSEALAFEACADLSNEILEKHNISQRYTGPELFQEFVGQNFRGMLTSLQSKFSFKIPDDELERYVKQEEDRVIKKIEAKGEPCPGANEVLADLYSQGQHTLAVVSSSALRRVQASLKKVGQDAYIPSVNVFSAATSLERPTSKPDPAIYLYAMEKLGAKPEGCVAVEDSKSGTMSAVRAGILTVGYVGSYETAEEREEMKGKLKEVGAHVIMEHWLEFGDLLRELQSGARLTTPN